MNPEDYYRNIMRRAYQPAQPFDFNKIMTSIQGNPASSFANLDKVFSEDLLRSLAESQINPEIARMYRRSDYGLQNQLGTSGGYRSGLGIQERKNLQNQFERQRKEQVENFFGQTRGMVDSALADAYSGYWTDPGRLAKGSGIVTPTQNRTTLPLTTFYN